MCILTALKALCYEATTVSGKLPSALGNGSGGFYSAGELFNYSTIPSNTLRYHYEIVISQNPRTVLNTSAFQRTLSATDQSAGPTSWASFPLRSAVNAITAATLATAANPTAPTQSRPRTLVPLQVMLPRYLVFEEQASLGRRERHTGRKYWRD